MKRMRRCRAIALSASDLTIFVKIASLFLVILLGRQVILFFYSQEEVSKLALPEDAGQR